MRNKSTRIIRTAAHATGTLRSTKFAQAGAVERLNQKWLCDHAHQARVVWILSAFYDVTFLHALAGAAKPGAQIRIALDQTAGSRLRTDVEALKGLCVALKRRNPRLDVQVRFVKAQGLFHSKVYGFATPNGASWFVGSANATTAAFERNEEILVPADPSATSSYASAVWKEATPLDEVQYSRPRNSLMQFFREGSIFFEPRFQVQFTYDGLHCPSDYSAALSENRATKLHVDLEPGHAVPGYNVKSALGITDNDRSQTRASLSPYAVETCLGFWVPEEYRKPVSDKAAEAGKHRRKALEDVARRLDSTRRAALMKRYDDMLTNVGDAAAAFNPRWRSKPGREPWHPPIAEARSGYMKFLDRLKARLSNDEELERASRRYVSTPMPEIWADPASGDAFTRSFFEYCEWALSCGGKQRNVVKKMRERFGWATTDDWSALQEKAKAGLEEHGWHNEDWQ